MSQALLLLLVSALLQVCLAQPLQVIQEFKINATVYNVAFDVDKGYAVTCDANGRAILWNLTTGQADQTMTTSGKCKGLAVDFVSMQALVITGWDTSEIVLWDLSTGTSGMTHMATGEGKGVLAANFSAMKAVTQTQQYIEVLDLNTGFASQTIHHECNGAKADLDRMEAVTVGPGSIIRLWDLVEGTIVRQVDLGNMELRTVAVDFAARRAIPAGDAPSVSLIDLDNMTVIGRDMWNHSGTLHEVVADFGAMRAITGSTDGSAVYWDLSTNNPIYTLQHGPDCGFNCAVKFIAADFTGMRAVTSGNDGQVALWDLSTGFSLSREYLGGRVESMVADMSKEFVFTGGVVKAILWSIATTTTTTTTSTTATTITTTSKTTTVTTGTETSTTSTTSTMSTTTATTRTETSTTSTASTMTTTMTMSSTTTATTRTETSTTSTTSTTMTMSSTTTATTRTATTTMVMMPTTTRISLTTSGSTRTSPRDTLVVGLAGLVMLLAWQAW